MKGTTMTKCPSEPVLYKGRPIGYPGYGKPHIDYVCSLRELYEIIEDPEATHHQKVAAQEELDSAMDDFS